MRGGRLTEARRRLQSNPTPPVASGTTLDPKQVVRSILDTEGLSFSEKLFRWGAVGIGSLGTALEVPGALSFANVEFARQLIKTGSFREAGKEAKKFLEFPATRRLLSTFPEFTVAGFKEGVTEAVGVSILRGSEALGFQEALFDSQVSAQDFLRGNAFAKSLPTPHIKVGAMMLEKMILSYEDEVGSLEGATMGDVFRYTDQAVQEDIVESVKALSLVFPEVAPQTSIKIPTRREVQDVAPELAQIPRDAFWGIQEFAGPDFTALYTGIGPVGFSARAVKKGLPRVLRKIPVKRLRGVADLAEVSPVRPMGDLEEHIRRSLDEVGGLDLERRVATGQTSATLAAQKGAEKPPTQTVTRAFVTDEAAVEKLARGPSSSEIGSVEMSAISRVQGLEQTLPDGRTIFVPSTDVAASHTKWIELPEEFPGQAIREVLGEGPYDEAVIQDYMTRLTGVDKEGNPWYHAWIPDETPTSFRRGTGKPGDFGPPEGVLPDGTNTDLFPPSAYTAKRDANAPSYFTQDPQLVLSGVPVGERVLDLVAKGRYQQSQLKGRFLERFQRVQAILSKDFKQRTERVYDALNTDPGTQKFRELFDSLSPDEKEAVGLLRESYNEAWGILKDAGHVTGESPGFLEGYAPRIWERSDFQGGAVPRELLGDPTTPNAFFAHILKRTGAKGFKRDAAMATRAYYAGLERKTIWQPIWKEMLNLAEGLPNNKRLTVHRWIDAMKGRPSVWAQASKDLSIAAARNGSRITRGGKVRQYLGNTVTDLTMMMQHMIYRGALLGNSSFFIQNFVTQGIMNPAAKYGWGRTLRAIGAHMDDAWRGIEPKEELLGGFQAIFEELPVGRQRSLVSDVSTQLKRLPGYGKLSSLAKGVERFQFPGIGGPVGAELLTRGISYHIGRARAMEILERTPQYIQRFGKRRITPQMMTDGTLPAQWVDLIHREGIRVSDDINFVYGVYGSNPIMRQIFGGPMVGTTFQFLSYFPKQTAWFTRNAFRDGLTHRKDPGLLLRYLMFVGALDRVSQETAGVSIREFSFPEELETLSTRARFSPLVGPIPQIALHLTSALASSHEGRREDAVRSFEEAGRAAELALPGRIQIKRMTELWHQAEVGTRINPFTGETLRTMQEEEIAAQFLGLDSVTEQAFKDNLKTLQRANRAMTDEKRIVGKQIRKAIADRDIPRFQELIQRMAEEGFNPLPTVRNALERVALPRLFRELETSEDIPMFLFVQQMMRDYPEFFDMGENQRMNRLIQEFERQGTTLEETLPSAKPRSRLEQAREALR